ncbi:hypothetical protein WNY78_13710 [Psychroserpens sp. AS72]|uniref:hypothetical protein n=1 Tax=Psychroserpens sp. AS72 TaxID=3135775 RepID=UPI0031735CB5
MKNRILTTVLLLCTILVFGQDEAKLGVLESDTTWLKEIIKFPIGFAPEIKYEGYEDLRFAKKWRDSAHDDFWAYMFAWHINSNEQQTVETLETNIKFYYDGIMKAVNKKKDFVVPETTVLFIKTEANKDTDFIGKLYVYDSFTSEAMMTLNVRVKSYYCIQTESSTILFKLSPQGFDHEIWKRFNEVTFIDDLCEK